VSSVTTIINDSTLAIYPAVATFYRDGSWLFCDAFTMSDLRMCVVPAIPAIFRPSNRNSPNLLILSDAERKTANNWIDNTLRSRLNDPSTGAIVMVMQRLHELDPGLPA
jgi:hypothetical protein